MSKISDSECETLLKTANWTRETGDLNDSIKIYQIILKAASENKFIHGQVHALTGIFKSIKLLNQQGPKPEYLVQMEKYIRQAKNLISPTIQPEDMENIYENIAEFYFIKNDWQHSSVWWQKLLSIHQKRDAYYGRILEHLAEVQFNLGKKEIALKNAVKAVDILKIHDERAVSVEHEYRWLVWYTGALMKLFRILYSMNNKESLVIQRELEALLSHPRLNHRRHQYQQLKNELKIN